jgi:hypothetical protein
MEACLLVDVGSAVPQLLPAQTSVYEVLDKVIVTSFDPWMADRRVCAEKK